MIDHKGIVPGDYKAIVHRDLSNMAGLAALRGA